MTRSKPIGRLNKGILGESRACSSWPAFAIRNAPESAANWRHPSQDRSLTHQHRVLCALGDCLHARIRISLSATARRRCVDRSNRMFQELQKLTHRSLMPPFERPGVCLSAFSPDRTHIGRGSISKVSPGVRSHTQQQPAHCLLCVLCDRSFVPAVFRVESEH